MSELSAGMSPAERLNESAGASPAERLEACVRLLTNRLGESVVDLTVEGRYAASSDRAGWADPILAGAAIHARIETDVAETLAAASRFRVPVVTRGAGTGLSGAAHALPGCLVLDVHQMNRIVEIDPTSGCAVVEPGVITADLDRAAAAHGLCFAPDPASAELSSVGGNISTNAGGLRCIKYGTTRTAVLGLRVVLPSGEIISLGGKTKKNSTGLDLLGLMVGAEGTLGVIVEATVALVPRPVQQRMVVAGCADWQQVQQCVLAIATAGVTPSLVELLDRPALQLRDPAGATRLGYPDDSTAILLVQTDGLGSDAEMAVLAEALAATGAQITAPLDDTLRVYAMALRRGKTLSGFADAQISENREEYWLGEDMTVPAAHLAEYCLTAEAIALELGITLSLVAHVGDGNLHPSLTILKNEMAEPDARAVLFDAAERLIRLAVSLGGNLSGEHGVGILKRAWIPLVLSPTVLELHRGVKATFDPLGIMNPGRAY